MGLPRGRESRAGEDVEEDVLGGGGCSTAHAAGCNILPGMVQKDSTKSYKNTDESGFFINIAGLFKKS